MSKRAAKRPAASSRDASTVPNNHLMRETAYGRLRFRFVDNEWWQVYDVSPERGAIDAKYGEPKPVGPRYPSRTALLQDLPRLAEAHGYSVCPPRVDPALLRTLSFPKSRTTPLDLVLSGWKPSPRDLASVRTETERRARKQASDYRAIDAKAPNGYRWTRDGRLVAR